MSIVDAIKKAKEQKKARSAHESATEARDDSSPRIDVPERPIYAVAAATQNAVQFEPVTAPAPIELPQFTSLAYDSIKCAANRILVPDAETRLTQEASPAYRMLRARLLRRSHVQKWSCIAVTSPGPTEGKSMTSLNLALSIAREGNYDVFLLDLDMRNPSIGNYLGVTPHVDIVDFFKGEIGPDAPLFTIGVERLTIASSTASTDNASELLATGRLRELLSYIRRISAKPFIIIDLPPIAVTDDALVVAPDVDATILVVSEGKTNREQLQRALGLLSDFTVAGVVLNNSVESMGTDYYGAT